MSFDQFKGKTAIIKSTKQEGTIADVIHKRGSDNRLGARYLVETPDKKIHELMPHEIKIYPHE